MGLGGVGTSAWGCGADGVGASSLPTGFFAYTCGCLVVVEDLHSGVQQHWLGHPEEISTLALSHDAQVPVLQPALNAQGQGVPQSLAPRTVCGWLSLPEQPFTQSGNGPVDCTLPADHPPACPPGAGLCLRPKQHCLPLPDPCLGCAGGLLSAAPFSPRHCCPGPGFLAR